MAKQRNSFRCFESCFSEATKSSSKAFICATQENTCSSPTHAPCHARLFAIMIRAGCLVLCYCEDLDVHLDPALCHSTEWVCHESGKPRPVLDESCKMHQYDSSTHPCIILWMKWGPTRTTNWPHQVPCTAQISQSPELTVSPEAIIAAEVCKAWVLVMIVSKVSHPNQAVSGSKAWMAWIWSTCLQIIELASRGMSRLECLLDESCRDKTLPRPVMSASSYHVP